MLDYGRMHGLPFLYSAAPFSEGILSILVPTIIIAVIWTTILKGFALWYAARNKQKVWFIALLIINTVGIIEIIYLIFFRPRYNKCETPADEMPTQE